MDTDRNPGEGPNGAKSFFEQVGVYQKIWADTMGKMMQSSMSFSPFSPASSSLPDFLRQMRGGVFQGQAKGWEEYLRSPQFLDGMRQCMENAIAMRKMTNDFLTRTHHEMQGTAHADIDAIMLAMRHMEQRILDRLEAIEQHVGMAPAVGAPQGRRTPARGRARRRAEPAAIPTED